MTITQMDDDLVYNNLIDPPPGPQPGPGPGPAPSPAAVVTAACTQNPMITLDGTNAPTVFLSPMSATDWITETQATFDTICSKPLGRNIVNSVQNKITVRPFPDRTAGASSSRTDGKESIEFTASALTTLSGPGTRADEGLFHELLHMLDKHFQQYENPRDNSMDWSGADFFTIIGTNVYSRLFARALRKDHGQPHFAFMPARYATDALEHMILFRENYKFAYQQNSGVFNLFKGQSADWNPFSSFTPNLVPESFTVEVENRWWWDFDLYGDGNARWIDQKNVAEYGIGKWRMEGNDYLINWKGGASDRFPKFKNGGWGFVEGHGRLASGTAYDSSVTARAPGSA